ncbi:diguanylate cyclase [Anaerobacillus sp. HL2]|nr:diguanylate cyclase [Anaerobacillus sp. HL2]
MTEVCAKALQTLRFLDVNGQQFFINASIGASSISTNQEENVILVKEAETAMRYVKERKLVISFIQKK